MLVGSQTVADAHRRPLTQAYYPLGAWNRERPTACTGKRTRVGVTHQEGLSITTYYGFRS